MLVLPHGERAAADEHFKAAARLGAQPPINRILGLAGALPATAAERRRDLHIAALKLDPSQLAARFDLANLLLVDRQFRAAAEQFVVLTQRAPNVASGITSPRPNTNSASMRKPRRPYSGPYSYSGPWIPSRSLTWWIACDASLDDKDNLIRIVHAPLETLGLVPCSTPMNSDLVNRVRLERRETKFSLRIACN